MERVEQEVLSPVGDIHCDAPVAAAARHTPAARRTVALLNNSKPNVGYFLDGVERELKSHGYDVVRALKPRSAGPCPDIERLASTCDYVINAVAD